MSNSAEEIRRITEITGALSKAGGRRITPVKSNTERTCYICGTHCLSGEKSVVTVSDDEIVIEYSSDEGLFYALNRIGGEMPENGTTECYPFFPVRGIIEGFYGTPWDRESRVNNLIALSEKGINTYYYAPKDDPFHRSRWKELYPGDEIAKLSELVGLCRERFITFHYCIAPGLSMVYSEERDYAALMAKINQLYDIGVRNFGLLLDDIPMNLYNAADKEIFEGESVNAHIFLINRLCKDLKAKDERIHLTICPTVYCGNPDNYYLTKLGRSIPGDVDIFHTGRDICSKELTLRESMEFQRCTGHRPLYWDNYPVNDAEMRNEMHLAPLAGRENDLYRCCNGVIFNVMEYPQSSLIPLFTAAEYLRNPLKYEPRKAFEKAVGELLGDDSEVFIPFADNLFFCCLKEENSSIFNSVINDYHAAMYEGKESEALGILSDYVSSLEKTAEYTSSARTPLMNELHPWGEKQVLAHSILNDIVAILSGEDRTEEAKKKYAQYRLNPFVLYDFSFEAFCEEVLK